MQINKYILNTKKVRRWDAESGAPVGDPLRAHEHWMTFVAVSPDGTFINSGSEDRTVRRRDVENGAPSSESIVIPVNNGHAFPVSRYGMAIASNAKCSNIIYGRRYNLSRVGDGLRV